MFQTVRPWYNILNRKLTIKWFSGSCFWNNFQITSMDWRHQMMFSEIVLCFQLRKYFCQKSALCYFEKLFQKGPRHFFWFLCDYAFHNLSFTRMLQFFLKTQRCKFGLRCKFNHPKEKLPVTVCTNDMRLTKIWLSYWSITLVMIWCCTLVSGFFRKCWRFCLTWEAIWTPMCSKIVFSDFLWGHYQSICMLIVILHFIILNSSTWKLENVSLVQPANSIIRKMSKYYLMDKKTELANRLKRH